MSNIAAFALGMMVAYTPSLIVLGFLLWSSCKVKPPLCCSHVDPASQAVILVTSQTRKVSHRAIAAATAAMNIIEDSFGRPCGGGGGSVVPFPLRPPSGKFPLRPV
jgi:hypothetical protein